jgi:hypothetical protein
MMIPGAGDKPAGDGMDGQPAQPQPEKKKPKVTDLLKGLLNR